MLLSVIVPVYKVEDYLENCVDSILNQTYKDLEIILVNDGSPDACGEICNRLAKEYAQIRVVHKQNGGLSSARNAGIEVAQGDAITFIDSDDLYGDVRTLEVGMSYLMEDDSLDIVQFPMQFTSMDGKIVAPFLKNKNQTYVERNEVVEELARWIKDTDANLNSSVCNKIFSKRLFVGCRFRDIYCEDIDFLLRVAAYGPKVLVQKEGVYIYYQREESIIHSHRSLKKLQDVVTLFGMLYAALRQYSDRYDYQIHCILVIESTLQEIYRNYGRQNWKRSLSEIETMQVGNICGDLKQKVKLMLMSILGMNNYSGLCCFLNYTVLKR